MPRAGKNLTAKNLLAFRRRFPARENLVVAGDAVRSWEARFGELKVPFLSLPELVATLRLALGQGAGLAPEPLPW